MAKSSLSLGVVVLFSILGSFGCSQPTAPIQPQAASSTSDQEVMNAVIIYSATQSTYNSSSPPPYQGYGGPQ